MVAVVDEVLEEELLVVVVVEEARSNAAAAAITIITTIITAITILLIASALNGFFFSGLDLDTKIVITIALFSICERELVRLYVQNTSAERKFKLEKVVLVTKLMIMTATKTNV